MVGLSTIPIDVWVDADNLLRKLEISLSAAPQGATGEMKASVTMEMFDYGEPVEIDVPPPSETVGAESVPGFTTS